MREWARKHQLLRRFRLLILICGAGAYFFSLIIYWLLLSLQVYTTPSIYTTLVELHPVTGGTAVSLTAVLYDRLNTAVLLFALLLPFVLLIVSVYLGYDTV